MASVRTDIRVRVRHSQEELVDFPREVKREAFWQPIINAFVRDDRDGQLDATVYEAAIRRDLPRRLQEAFHHVVSSGEDDGRPAVPVMFAVTSINYSSLDIGIGIEPLSKVVELFDRNFDYFRVAIEQFVPGAVEETIMWAAETGVGRR